MPKQVVNTINARFAQYLAVLDSSAGLFVASGKVRRARLGGVLRCHRFTSKYPGISSLQYPDLRTQRQS